MAKKIFYLSIFIASGCVFLLAGFFYYNHTKKIEFSTYLEAGKTEDALRALKKIGNVDFTYNGNVTPLYQAADYGNDKVVYELVRRGANINVQDELGWTPLHIAASNGHVKVVKILLDSGADINARNNTKALPPLILAAVGGREDVVRLLISRGADKRVTGSNGTTAISAVSAMAAEAHGSNNKNEEEKFRAIFDYLISIE